MARLDTLAALPKVGAEVPLRRKSRRKRSGGRMHLLALGKTASDCRRSGFFHLRMGLQDLSLPKRGATEFRSRHPVRKGNGSVPSGKVRSRPKSRNMAPYVGERGRCLSYLESLTRADSALHIHSVEFEKGIERDAVLPGDGGEGVSLSHDVCAAAAAAAAAARTRRYA